MKGEGKNSVLGKQRGTPSKERRNVDGVLKGDRILHGERRNVLVGRRNSRKSHRDEKAHGVAQA